MSMQTGSSKEVGLKADAVSLGRFHRLDRQRSALSSVAFTLAILLSFAGHTSPLAVLVVGIAMFFVSVGYANLNRWRAHEPPAMVRADRECHTNPTCCHHRFARET